MPDQDPYAAFGGSVDHDRPAERDPYAAFGGSVDAPPVAKDSGSGSFLGDAASSFLDKVNPLHSVPALYHALTDRSEFAKMTTPGAHGEPSELAKTLNEANRRKSFIGPPAPGQNQWGQHNTPPPAEDIPSYGSIVGNAAGDVANSALVAGATAGLVKGFPALANAVKKAREPNPDLTFQNAVTVHPSDTDFKTKVPSIRAGIKRGEDITGEKITNPDSAVAATEAAQAELMDALADHKTNARRNGLMMPVAEVKRAQLKAIPAGLEDSDPLEYQSLYDAIQNQFPNKQYLSVDDVFNQARLNNSRLHAFYSGKESAQNAKLTTNAGDTGVLKAAGDSYRKWIADNLGPEAANINKKWGDLNGAKHYLQAKINQSVREQPVTPLEGHLDDYGIDLGTSNPVHGIIKGVGKKVIGRPSGIDALLKSTFENTQADTAPLRPQIAPFVKDQRRIGPGDIVTPPPADTSGSIPYPVTPGGMRVGFPQKALPPGTSKTITTPPPADTSGSIPYPVSPGGMKVGFGQKALPPATHKPPQRIDLGSRHGDILRNPVIDPKNDPLGLAPFFDERE